MGNKIIISFRTLWLYLFYVNHGLGRSLNGNHNDIMDSCARFFVPTAIIITSEYYFYIHNYLLTRRSRRRHRRTGALLIKSQCCTNVFTRSPANLCRAHIKHAFTLYIIYYNTRVHTT